MQTTINNKTELEMLRIKREMLYTDLIQQLKYLKDKQLSMVKAYKHAVDNIDKDILTLVRVENMKNGKNRK